MEKYNKLVRDKIPSIITNNGEFPVTRILNDKEYKIELERKLYEEYQEVINSKDKDRLEELADMIEVIKALASLEGKNLQDIILIAEQKREKRGGFKDRIYLERVLKK